MVLYKVVNDFDKINKKNMNMFRESVQKSNLVWKMCQKLMYGLIQNRK